MNDFSTRQKPTLPQQWVEEMALAGAKNDSDHPISTVGGTSVSVEPPSSASPVHTSTHPVFDRQLDGFLDRFQKEIHDARFLKDDLDHCTSDQPDYLVKKHNFKLKMQHIRALFSTEGEDFLASLERHNPKLSMAVYGENTIELAQGIDRLETAVQEEESKRGGQYVPEFIPPPHTRPDVTVSSMSASSTSFHEINQSTPGSAPTDRLAAPPIPVNGIGHALNNLTSDETLQLMQSDIQALKLELMRLQRSKVTNGSFAQPTPHSLPNRSVGHGSEPVSGGSPFSLASISPDKDGVPASILANHGVNVVRVKGRATGVTPTYVSHLEQMKSRIEALEKKPLSRRAKSVARLGRTQTMGSMYEASPSISGDENQNPNIAAMITPPRNIRRSKHRSISTSSPLAPHRMTPPTGSLRRMSPLRIQRSSVSGSPEVVRVGVSMASPSSTPSPKRPSFTQAEGAEKRGSLAGSHEHSGASASPAKLFFDAPEEMLSRPQSHAAARDIQRYSLKVARRFVPVGAPDRITGDGGNGMGEASMQRGRAIASGASESVMNAHPVGNEAHEPRAKSAVSISPTRRATIQNESGPFTHAVSEGMNDSVPGVVNSPSTIDTSGSGGRVVEEIEGDMWVRKGLVWKRWRRRYASIVSHQFFGKVMCLFSYDSSGGVISTRSQIVVLNSSLCRSCKELVEIGGSGRYVFQLRTSSKEYYFAAESDEIRRNWIKELRDAARLDVARVVPKKSGRSMAFRKKT